MRACLLSFLLIGLFAGNAFADDLIKVIVYGDSLTAGYRLQPEQAFPARLERKIKEYGFDNVQVINMSVVGETSEAALDRMNSLVVQHPDIVVLELGQNDVLRGIKVDIIYKNIATILARLSADKVYVVLVGVKAPDSAEYAYASQLDAAFRQMAEHYHVALYPYALDGVSGRQDLSLADGLHPNAQGVALMVERIYPLVDTGLRWKEQMIQYQQQYQQHIDEQKQGAPVPPPAGVPH